MRGLLYASISLLFSLCSVALDASVVHLLGPQGVNLWKLDAARRARSTNHPHGLVVQQANDFSEYSDAPVEFPERWFTQPLDHFSNSSHTFEQRYWINTRHYKPGSDGPVIILDGGETSGEDRIPFLDTGIVEILARATGGVGVVLEHRYYGSSMPVENLTTDSLRWLNNEQAAADSANFMANVQFPGIDEDLTAPSTPWIYYGGSYAGARAAHMKILYPKLVYGAIASSGVTHASIVNWEYTDVIRRAANPECSSNLQRAVEFIDTVLSVPLLRTPLKRLFGLAELEHDDDFASVLESPLGYWQGKNWDPSINSNGFDIFCAALNKSLRGDDISSGEITHDENAHMLLLPGGLSVPLVVYNYAQYVKEHIVSKCPEDLTVEECYGTYDDIKFQGASLDETWRLWLFQVCTEWGYFTTAPPSYIPRIISNRITLEYESKICRQAFAPGKYFIVPQMPNVTAVNILGDFYIAADRLAIIDGEVDPWRPDTPHSEYAPDRLDTILRPFKLIPGGVHHYDEYGLRDISAEPPEIEQIHLEMIVFVKEWLKDWEPPKRS